MGFFFKLRSKPEPKPSGLGLRVMPRDPDEGRGHSPEFQAWISAGKPGEFKDFANQMHVDRAAGNPMGIRFAAVRDALSSSAQIDTTSRQGPCRTAMTNLHGRKLETRQSNASTRFTVKVNNKGQVEVKDDRYVVGYLSPENAEAFLSVAGEEKVWIYGHLRFRPNDEVTFTADFDWSKDHEGNRIA